MSFFDGFFSDLVVFFDNNKGFLGGFSIAMATVIAVLINYRYVRRTETRQRNERIASFAAAMASELADNTENLINLYTEIKGGNFKLRKINEFQNFQLNAYEKLFEQIGSLGADLSYIIVDVYGDMQKLSLRIDLANKAQIEDEEEDFLHFIQDILAKALTASIITILYSDHLQGPEYSRSMHQSRRLWIERSLDNFCSSVSEAEEDMDFIDSDEKEDLEFIKRFPQREDRQKIRELFQNIDQAVENGLMAPDWKAPLIYRALAYKIRNVLAYFLQFEQGPYQDLLEKEYSQYIR